MNSLLVISFFNEFEPIYLHISIDTVQLNGFNYCYLTLTILFDINHLFAHSEVVRSIANSSIWAIDRNLSGATTPGQSGPERNYNEEVLHIFQSSRTRASQCDGNVSYLGHSLRGSYPSTEMQSVYSTAPAEFLNCHGTSYKAPKQTCQFFFI